MSNSPEVKAIIADSSYASIDKMIERTYFFLPGFTKAPFVWLTKLYSGIFLGLKTADLSPVNEISKAKAQILLIHGDKDSQIYFENSQLLYEASNKSKTEFWIVPGADHGQAYSLNPRVYENRVFDFFDKYL